MLEDRTCLVTGGSRGIGRAIATELGRLGADVVVNYRASETAAAETAEAIDGTDGSAMTARADVSEYDQVESMRAAVHDRFGPVDVLVNNAGITADRRFEEMTREDWDRVVDVNLGGTFNCTSCFFEDVRAADEGRLINISSVVGQQGNYGQANYATTKSGLFGFTRTLALELAAEGSTANCVAPGFVDTGMLDTVPGRVKEKIRRRIPLGRFARPEDVAGIVRFLAGEDSSYMTGQILAVNGGMDW